MSLGGRKFVILVGNSVHQDIDALKKGQFTRQSLLLTNNYIQMDQENFYDIEDQPNEDEEK